MVSAVVFSAPMPKKLDKICILSRFLCNITVTFVYKLFTKYTLFFRCIYDIITIVNKLYIVVFTQHNN